MKRGHCNLWVCDSVCRSPFVQMIHSQIWRDVHASARACLVCSGLTVPAVCCARISLFHLFCSAGGGAIFVKNSVPHCPFSSETTSHPLLNYLFYCGTLSTLCIISVCHQISCTQPILFCPHLKITYTLSTRLCPSQLKRERKFICKDIIFSNTTPQTSSSCL